MSTGALDRLTALDRPTVGVVSRLLREAFTGSGEAARVEARAIVGHVLGLDLTGLLADGDRPVEPKALVRIAAMAARRLAGEPIQRVIGEADFFGRAFRLSAETLVPRPDTETLVEAVLARLMRVEAPVVADLGVGSGAILVTLLAERSDARGVASDLSGEALATARANAERHAVADRALFVEGSYASMLAPEAFDAIVSNPPYVASAVVATLDPEVRLHDPHLALDGGSDGLEAYRVIAREAADAPKPGGLLAVEIGFDQGAAVAALFAAAGWEEVEILPDLAGRDRVLVARKPRGARFAAEGAK